MTCGVRKRGMARQQQQLSRHRGSKMDSVEEERIELPNLSPSIARPPPSRSQMVSLKEERITEMVERSRPYYHRKCKRERSMNMFNSLPDELLFDILIRLSAQDITDNARFVCRKWSHMIHAHDFIHAHLHRTSYGILFHMDLRDSLMATMKQGQIEISRYKNYKYMIGTSCNGLISGKKLYDSSRVYIINPVTRDVFFLPPLDGFEGTIHCSGIGYAAASMKYKVVSSAHPPKKLSSPQPCAILTVGVDKSWRIVPTQHLSYKSKMALRGKALTTEGFLHWTQFRDPVLTLNVETEILIETRPPISEFGRCTYLSAERYLSLLVECGEFSWQVWEMKPESGEWRKLQLEIAIEAQNLNLDPSTDYGLRPIAWLKYLEVLVFDIISRRFRPICFVYNLGSHEINSIQLPFSSKLCRALVHKSSLLWLSRY